MPQAAQQHRQQLLTSSWLGPQTSVLVFTKTPGLNGSNLWLHSPSSSNSRI
ncbi:UNVERIFIED_CONTAM: hypothetical protein FKN15_077478 [Acipenser sinensis]